MFYLPIVLLILVTVSCLLTWSIRRYAIARDVMDHPNHRSSHLVPTPRGGGLAFVAVFLMTVPLVVHLGFLTLASSLALTGAGFFVAILGFLDDHHHIRAHWRLLAHFFACVMAVFLLGGLPPMTFFAWTLPANVVADVLGVIYLVWLLNLYNFMDGIDGIAAVEAVSVCFGASVLYYLNGDIGLILMPLLLAAAVGGFLFWNFPVARIFMGDAGSSFLGFSLGVLSIQAAWINKSYLWCWLILLGVFIVDATLTLLCRFFRGEVIHEAHRTHAYQKATSYFGRHLPVTLFVLMINIGWLFPMSLMTSLGYMHGLTGLLIAYTPLVILAIWFKAGRPD